VDDNATIPGPLSPVAVPLQAKPLLMARPATTRRIAGAAAAAALTLAAAGAVLAVLNRGTPTVPGAETAHVAGQLVLALMYTGGGWVLAARCPGVVFGWLALAAGSGLALASAGTGWGVYAVTGGRELPGAGAALLAAIAGESLQNLVVVAVLVLFPDGRLPRGRLRWLAVAAGLLCGVGWLLGLVTPVQPLAGRPQLANPIGVLRAPVPPALLFAAGLLAASVVIVLRWLRADGRQRQVLRWLAVVNLAAIALTPVIVLLPAGDLIAAVAAMIELLVIASVVLAHQLYGIDTALNRTLVYTLLLALVLAVYGAVIALGALAGQRAGGAWTLAAALIAAFALAPARNRAQRLVNRFLYGRRDEPYAVISRIASRLEASGSVPQLLPGLLDAIIGELRLPWAAVELRHDDGTPWTIVRGACRPGAASAGFPLAQGAGKAGALVVGLRTGQAELAAGEARLLENIAAQVAVAARNVVLTEALIRSRARIVAAAEDERRRLRRDLHDGLGPVLTAAAAKVEAAGNLLEKDPGKARGALASVRADLTTALDDLRRLVYALRPPVLDQLGLLESLRQQLPRISVPVTLTAPDALPPLPGAVEVAAYRIVTEAVTNVRRHAAATRCTVHIACAERLTLDIRDNGTTSRRWHPGVGLTSMQERVTALGGTWHAGPTPAGGRVRVELPLSLTGGTP
jgi:signal transduction histidine kinase